jgi:biopolymer transport protein TolR
MTGPVVRNSFGKRRTLPLNSTINITPLVDVMLVLMVIFMVTAPMLSVGGVAVDLPKVSAKPLSQNQEEPLIISIDAEGHIFLQKTPIVRADLILKLEAIVQQNPETSILIKADQSVRYAQVMAVMNALSQAGLQKVSFIVEQNSSS